VTAYQASPIKQRRHRAAKAEFEERRETLLAIIERINPSARTSPAGWGRLRHDPLPDQAADLHDDAARRAGWPPPTAQVCVAHSQAALRQRRGAAAMTALFPQHRPDGSALVTCPTCQSELSHIAADLELRS
jgi:hypothetical protein